MIVAGWTLIASACSTAPVDPVVKTELIRPVLPSRARQACAAPMSLPERALSAAETVGLWGSDRAALRTCESRRAAAVAAVEAGR